MHRDERWLIKNLSKTQFIIFLSTSVCAISYKYHLSVSYYDVE